MNDRTLVMVMTRVVCAGLAGSGCASVTVARLGEALEILLKFYAVLMIEEMQALMHAPNDAARLAAKVN
jgi:hypothetical protein